MSSSGKRPRPFPIVLSSPSGAGKTSIARGVVGRETGIVYSISATTRPRRPGERHGRDYYFYSPARFRNQARAGRLLETAEVYGHLYGTPKPPILRALRRGLDVIADLDIQGARSLRRLMPDTVTVFIVPPGLTELRRRLVRRGTDSREVIARRLACARREWRAASEFDYLVVNRTLDQAIADVRAIIRAEHLKTRRAPPALRRAGSKGGS
jgi:guanylate kinase